MAETYLNAEPSSSATADRYQVVVHVSAETSRRLACDCSILKLTEDSEGEILSIGRKTRAIPPSIRRALRFRDGGCRFPGCTHTSFVDGHHIPHWADDGETSLANLVQLCRHHHRLVHEGEYACERSVGGRIEFRSPSGALLRAHPPVSRASNPSHLKRWL